MDFLRSLFVVSLIILSCLQNSHESHESIIRGCRRGVCKVQKILSETQSKTSNSIKCIISNKSKFYPGKSKKSKFNTWNSGRSNFFTETFHREVKESIL